MVQTDLIIDTNIWMNRGYDSVFKALAAHLKAGDHRIPLYNAQFEMICDLKERTHYKSSKNLAARCALTRIEEFQVNGLLMEEFGISGETSEQNASPVVGIVLTALEQQKKVSLVTDDRALRLRLRSHCKNQLEQLELHSGRDLLPLSEAYCEMKELKVETADIDECYAEMKSGSQE